MKYLIVLFFLAFLLEAKADLPATPVNIVSLEKRTFKVDANLWTANLQSVAKGLQSRSPDNDVLTALKQFFAENGVDLSTPPKSIFYNRHLGTLYVTATPQDLVVIEQAMKILNYRPPMVHIKARFLEVPKKFFAEANSFPHGLTNGGVLTLSQEIKLLRQIEHFKGTQEIAEPEVTTICGRQTEMRAVTMQSIVTNYVVVAQPTNRDDNIAPQVGQIETGPVLDVFATGLSDGYRLDLRVIPSEIEFLGYADPKGLPKRTAIDSQGDKIELPNVMPLFKVYETTMQKTIYDGQTLVLAPTAKQVPPAMNDENWSERIADFFSKSEKEEDKSLIVLVTATLIDPAGNRVHSGNEPPFEQH